MKRNIIFNPGTIFKKQYIEGNSVEWIQSGEAYFNMLEQSIDAAQKEIHLQTYIFSSDETGTRIAEALLRAALRKVEIYIVVDAFGSNDLRPETKKRFEKAGINFREYGKIFSQGRFHIGRRLHHKIVVIDGTTSLVGGINISNNYNSIGRHTAWLDFAVLMKGNISKSLRKICIKNLGHKFKDKIAKNRSIRPDDIKTLPGDIPIRTRINDFTRNKVEVSVSYRESIRKSNESVLIVGGYLLPGGKTRRLLKQAVERGVKVTIIISEVSDVKILVNARKYLYNWFLKNNIDVYEYTLAYVHGKVLIVDKSWTSIGSFDMNNLSNYSNIELNVDINDKNFSETFANHIHFIKNNYCRMISLIKPVKSNALIFKFKIWLAFRVVKILFVLSVLLAGDDEKKI